MDNTSRPQVTANDHRFLYPECLCFLFQCETPVTDFHFFKIAIFPFFSPTYEALVLRI